jgi:putative mRNA 3-end processing factor
MDRGFIMSDHADWPGLLRAIEATRARRVFATHGYSTTLARFLRERGIDAQPIETRFRGEAIEDEGDKEADE